MQGEADRSTGIPLSYAQLALWFNDRLQDGDASYHMPVAMRLTGIVDVDALRAALDDVIGRHAALRTVFPERDGTPYQHVLDPAEVVTPLTVAEADEEELPELIAAACRVLFDLTADPLLRLHVFVLGPREHVVLMVQHHIAGDGWSMAPLARDLSAAYLARSQGREPVWAPLQASYADYALEQRESLGDLEDPDSGISGRLGYWSKALDGIPDCLELPTDHPRPAVKTFEGDYFPWEISAELHRELLALTRTCRVSLFMLVQAALATVLTRSGSGTDIPIASPTAGRMDERYDDVVGYFVNPLVLRVDTSGDPTFRELLKRVRRVDLQGFSHQEMPIERLITALNPPRSLGWHPLFQVMLAFQNLPKAELVFPGVDIEFVEADPGGARFDLSFNVMERRDDDGGPGGLTCFVEYSSDLFDLAGAEALMSRLTLLLEAVAGDPDQRIGSIDLLTPEDRAALPAAWNGPALPSGAGAPPDVTFHRAFEERAAADPDRIAVVAGATRLTFAEVNARANRLARELVRRGAGPERYVVLMASRDADVLVSLLAILKSGAAYVPVAVDTPGERLAGLLDTVRPVCVIVSGACVEAPWDHPAACAIDDPLVTAAVAAHPSHDLTDADRTGPTGPGDAAYVIHTSGSTGTPKGVVVEHRSLTNLMRHHRARLVRPGTPDGLDVALVASLTFDTSWEPLFWMLEGHRLHLLCDEVRLDPAALVAYVRRERVAFLDLTPTYVAPLIAAGLLDEDAHRPEVLMLGGEAVGPDLWTRLAAVPGVAVHNYYGPTETTVDALACALGDSATPVIGRPIDGVRAYVLDEFLRPAPVGVRGELYLAGVQVARGYLGRAALTAERFVADPYGPPGARMYRTGDLARLRRDGRVEYLGRADEQVKIRGFRIEPGEIEAVLEQYPGIVQAAVVVRGDSPDDRFLAGYLALAPGAAPDPAELRAHLARRLPDYMIPAAYSHLDALPLTSSGKLDRAALPEPEVRISEGPGRAPEGPAETALCALFAEVLRMPEVGPDQDFFTLGGHSLLAMRLISRIRTVTGADLTVRSVFEARTPAGLARLVGADGSGGGERRRPALLPAERPDRIPLSYAQRRLWFLQRLDRESPAYHIPLPLRLDGPIDIGALAAALGDVVERHESLRTVFPDDGGAPRQLVLDPRRLPPLLDVLPLRPDDADGAALDAVLAAAASEPFDLAHRPPVRARVFRIAPERHLLLLTIHHIACDAWSLGPLARDLGAAYRARLAGGEPDRGTPLAVQYADYTLWQHALLGDDQDPRSLAAEQWAHWSEALRGLPEEIALPVDRRRTAATGHAGGVVPLRVDASVHRALVELAGGEGASLFMAVQAGLAGLLTRLGAGTDIPLGTPVAGRLDEGLGELVGFFVNTLVLRTRTEGNPTFRELLRRVRETDLAAYAHQDLPFERLVDLVNPARSPGRHPLFQVALVMNQAVETSLDIPGVSTRGMQVGLAPAKFDLTFTLGAEPATDGTAGALVGSVEYRADLFDESTAAALADRLARLLTAVAADPDLPLSRVGLLADEERTRILEEWNDTRRELPPTTLADAVAEQIARTPEATAVVFEGAAVSYAELDGRVDALARRLTAAGVGPGSRVAVALPRSVELVAALCAVHRAGGAHVPLDPDYPAERLAFMLADARPAALVAAGRTADALGVPEGLTVVDPWAGATDEPAGDGSVVREPVGPSPSDPAYVIYTSGSTGRPKGVVVPHEGVANRLRWGQEEYRLTSVDRVLQKTPSSFDVSVWEFFWPLTTGATLVVAKPEGHRDPAYLSRLIREERITVAQFVPSMLDAFLQDPDAGRCRSLRLVVASGEALGSATARRFREVLPDVLLVDLYGPTEASIEVTAWACGPDDDPSRPVPIGRPVWNTRVYVLDAELQPVPPGVTGDLYLAGVQLARGYLDRPALTAERFVADPHGAPGTRMYRTGDLARLRADGVIEYQGRVDGQVKVRGFRIELGEIEAVLREHPAVGSCAVVVREDPRAASRIVAYLVPAPGGAAPGAEELRTHLRGRLPEHMVPTAYVPLDAIPVTANGKLDRAALPDPAAVVGDSAAREPRTPLEKTLTTLFADLLDVPVVRPDDDFFLLGGHSLLMVRLAEGIRAELGVDLPIRTLFDCPTPRLIAERLSGMTGLATGPASTAPAAIDPVTVPGPPLPTTAPSADQEAALPAWEPLLALRAQGSRPPLFCVHPVVGDGFGYAGLLRGLGPDQPVYALQGIGPAGGRERPADMGALAAEYARRIREVRPNGPYRLLGWSFGGVLVHEIAIQLKESGESVDLVALMDSTAPTAADVRQGTVTEGEVLLRLLDAVRAPRERMEAAADGRWTPDAEELLRLLAPALGASAPRDAAQLAVMLDTCRYHGELMARWFPRVLDGGLLTFTATAEFAYDGPGAGAVQSVAGPQSWVNHVVGRIEDHPIDARHLELADPGPIDEIGRILAAALERREVR
ncbi:amino acid adenylation domain-containing protein [Streptomyces sp. NPDC060334]|uniref:amino acid adenylation domain-containing protein n=1 Tax=Streptomyces sp. NPDC060334 TaxID=3347099 RepID=UPI003664E5C6